ncbi:MAG TPA: hypothetical protein VE961_07420 [Pyrinomonadaceae bacterium]|nr:hypothetical protein [Pyrinomonadaceae bacterium]
MKTRGTVGIVALALTLGLMIPVLFFVTRGAVSQNQFIVILAGGLALVLWTIPYATLVDPALRKLVGAVFGTEIGWGGTSNALHWATSQEAGCLASLFVELLGYFFIILWFVPPAAIVLVLWLRH